MDDVFNPQVSRIMHIDINSCFASIEQQENPSLRGKPLVVAAFTTPRGCILAASIEAKRLGIKTGMRVMDGRLICPALIVLPSDPPKYRKVHLKLRKLVSSYTDDYSPKSIDEFVLNLENYLYVKTVSCTVVAQEIKARIKKEVGDYLTVSIGIAPNQYLAKVAAGLTKPDGLDEINKDNFLEIYSKLKLTGLTGIKERSAVRLNSVGIHTVLDFYNAPVWKLKAAFNSINGLYWHKRLLGYEIDNYKSKRSSFGNSVSIGKSLSKIEELTPILGRLTEKMTARLRNAGYQASGVHLNLIYKNGQSWHKGQKLACPCFDTRDFYKVLFKILNEASPKTPVLNIAVSCFNLTKFKNLQMELFDDSTKKEKIVKAQDFINSRWGEFTIGSARSFGGAKMVMDRISFGGISDLT